MRSQAGLARCGGTSHSGGRGRTDTALLQARGTWGWPGPWHGPGAALRLCPPEPVLSGTLPHTVTVSALLVQTPSLTRSLPRPLPPPGAEGTPVFGEDADEPCARERERVSVSTGRSAQAYRGGRTWGTLLENPRWQLVTLRQQGREQTPGRLPRLALRAAGPGSPELSWSCGGRPGCPRCQADRPQWPRPGPPCPGLWPPCTAPPRLLCSAPRRPFGFSRAYFGG